MQSAWTLGQLRPNLTMHGAWPDRGLNLACAVQGQLDLNLACTVQGQLGLNLTMHGAWPDRPESGMRSARAARPESGYVRCRDKKG